MNTKNYYYSYDEHNHEFHWTVWKIVERHINGNEKTAHRIAKCQEESEAIEISGALNKNQELVTRLYNLVNAVETADKDDRTVGSVSLRIEEARETLKKVIQ